MEIFSSIYYVNFAAILFIHLASSSSSSSAASLGTIGSDLQSSCGGFIKLNATTSVELHYEIPPPTIVNGTIETSENSSTCVWVIWTKSGSSIGFNLTQLDTTHRVFSPSLGSTMSMHGVLSIQQGVRDHQNYTTARLLEAQDLSHEVIINETWTVLVFRHYVSNLNLTYDFEGKGFSLTLRSLQENEKNGTTDTLGVSTDFLGGPMATSNGSKFIYPDRTGQPQVIIVNSRHGQTLQVIGWTILMARGQVANFYRFSKDLNKFAYVQTLVPMVGSRQYYGTLEGDQDQPILFYLYAGTITPTFNVTAGILHLSYSYKTMTNNNLTSNATAVAPMTSSEYINGTMETANLKSKPEEVTGSSREWITVLCVALALGGMMTLSIALCIVMSKNWTGRNRTWRQRQSASGSCVNSSINYFRHSNERLDKVSLTDSDETCTI